MVWSLIGLSFIPLSIILLGIVIRYIFYHPSEKWNKQNKDNIILFLYTIIIGPLIYFLIYLMILPLLYFKAFLNGNMSILFSNIGYLDYYGFIIPLFVTFIAILYTFRLFFKDMPLVKFRGKRKDLLLNSFAGFTIFMLYIMTFLVLFSLGLIRAYPGYVNPILRYSLVFVIFFCLTIIAYVIKFNFAKKILGIIKNHENIIILNFLLLIVLTLVVSFMSFPIMELSNENVQYINFDTYVEPNTSVYQYTERNYSINFRLIKWIRLNYSDLTVDPNYWQGQLLPEFNLWKNDHGKNLDNNYEIREKEQIINITSNRMFDNFNLTVYGYSERINSDILTVIENRGNPEEFVSVTIINKYNVSAKCYNCWITFGDYAHCNYTQEFYINNVKKKIDGIDNLESSNSFEGCVEKSNWCANWVISRKDGDLYIERLRIDPNTSLDLKLYLTC